MSFTGKFADFTGAIAQGVNTAGKTPSAVLGDALRLAQDGDVAVYYAPFDHINADARVVLVGITPGLTQAIDALNASRLALSGGASSADASRAGKLTGAFSGPMRNNLIALLDTVGLPKALGIAGAAELFGARAALLHTASTLRYPVFVKDQNYKGTPNMLRHPLLKTYVAQYFVPLAARLPNALFIPLGPKPTAVMDSMIDNGQIEPQRVLAGLPHPSGANAERIAYFTGRKPRAALSAKTNADNLDAAKAGIIERLAAYPA